MHPDESSHTLAAHMTPKGAGGIAVIHLAGPRAAEILKRCFVDKHLQFADPPRPGKIRYGFIAASRERIIDEVLVAALSDELFEINCHGGYIAVREALDLLGESGARVVASDEMLTTFGVLRERDNLQREAYRLLLQAQSPRAAAHLVAQFEGALSRALGEVRSGIREDSLPAARKGVEHLLRTAPFGLALARPARVVIVGAPNVGKSSLLNALLHYERAIVADVPGTTRDIVHGTTLIKQIAFELGDTAGLREPETHPEEQGVLRAEAAMESADCVVLMFDLTTETSDGGIEALSRLARSGRAVVVCLNKADLAKAAPAERTRQTIEKAAPGLRVCCTSCRTGDGVEDLRQALYSACIPDVEVAVPDALIFMEQQQDALERINLLLKEKESLCPEEKRKCLEVLDELSGPATAG
ncbi:MAG: GTPase [Planctomycetota bacterium]